MALFEEPLIPKKSIKGIMIDKMVKAIFLNAVSYADGATTPIMEEKLKNGFVNPEMKIIYDILSDIIALDEPMRKPGQDHIRDLYTGLRNVLVVTLDEDSHYLQRFYLFCKLINDHYPELEEGFRKSRVVRDWDFQAKWMDEQIARKKAGLPVDYTPLTAILAGNIHAKSPETIAQIRAEKKQKEEILNEGHDNNSGNGDAGSDNTRDSGDTNATGR